MHTHSCLYTHWTSFIPHLQKRNIVFGLLNRAYKIARTIRLNISFLINNVDMYFHKRTYGRPT